MIIYTHPVAGNLPMIIIKTLVVRPMENEQNYKICLHLEAFVCRDFLCLCK